MKERSLLDSIQDLRFQCSTVKGTNLKRNLNYIPTETPQSKSYSFDEISSSKSENHDSSKKRKGYTGICLIK